jgi:hypothetical protein
MMGLFQNLILKGFASDFEASYLIVLSLKKKRERENQSFCLV